MDQHAPPRAPKESDPAYRAWCAWCALPQRPRTVPDLVRATGMHETAARRWRKSHAWDARAALWDADQAGVHVPEEHVEPDVSGIEDPILAARAVAQADLLACVRRVRTLAEDTKLKPHLRLAANLALMEVAGLAKVSRPKAPDKDPTRTARLLAERLSDRASPDVLRSLLSELGEDDGGD